MLRSDDWIRERNAQVGGKLFLDMPEMGVKGLADVLSIDPCPEIEPGPGRVIMSTFAHTSGTVYDLRLEGEDEPIGVTATHLIWAPDRNRWVPAAELRVGEGVETRGGFARVQSITRRSDTAPVYNIEVEGDHCYRVGMKGVLVHNASDWDPQHVDGSNAYVVAAATYRGASSDLALRNGKRNLGRAKYRTKDGIEKWYKPQTFVIGTAGLGKHAEAQIQIYLKDQEGYGCGLVVLEVFTERYPCDVCASQFLDDMAHNNNGAAFTVYWFAPHGENFDTDPAGKQLRDEYAQAELFPWP
jgi:hypothetical protein